MLRTTAGTSGTSDSSPFRSFAGVERDAPISVIRAARVFPQGADDSLDNQHLECDKFLPTAAIGDKNAERDEKKEEEVSLFTKKALSLHSVSKSRRHGSVGRAFHS